MTPFDGPFADTYVLPLAIAAYISATPPTGFAKTWEIVASAAAVAQLTAPAGGALTAVHAPQPHLSALRAMVRQPSRPIASDQVGRQATFGDVAPPAPNLHFGWVTADTQTSTLSIAIRGTQYVTDWMKDLDFLAVPYQPVANSTLVHQGFQIVYESIRDGLLGIVTQAQTEFPALKTILITGHSLGAAVVCLAAPDIILSVAGALVPLVYTFAEPRVGHPSYKSFFDATVPVCYRIDNVYDIVPHVPPILALYEHEGQELVINSGFSLSIAHNHDLATGYVPGLAQWIKDHPAVASHSPALQLVRPDILVGVSP